MDWLSAEHGQTSVLNLQSLCDLSKLEKMDVNTGKRLIYAQFLTQSASAQTLTHLAIEKCRIDLSCVQGLSRFHNLQHLSLSHIFYFPTAGISDMVWQQRKLNKLAGIRLMELRQFISLKLLTHLTSAHNSLHKISLHFDWPLTDAFIVTVNLNN